MEEKTKTLNGRRIGIFGKGGAGKSTVVILLAKVLRDRGYEVCVLDADSTNVGFHLAMGLNKSPVPLMKFFGGTVFSGGVVTCPVDDPTPLAGAEVSLDKLPREYYAQNQEGIALLVAGKIGDQGPGAGCDGPVTKIARDLRVHKRGQHLVTLVDFKAGLEDSARGVITSLDWIIVVIDPTIAAIQIASDMKDMVKQIKAGAMPATAHLHDPQRVESATRLYRKANIKGVLFVLNNVIDDGTENYLKKRLNVKEIESIGTIHSDSSIAMAWLKGTLLEGEKIKKDVERIAGELESAEQAYSIIAPPLL